MIEPSFANCSPEKEDFGMNKAFIYFVKQTLS